MGRIDLADKFRGVIFGTAVGDALGYPIEFLSLDRLYQLFPRGVRDYVEWIKQGDAQVAPYSDDTQMTCAVLEGLLQAHTLIQPARAARAVADEFIRWSHEAPSRAPGNACLAGVRKLEAGCRYEEAGGLQAKGCGAAMRSQAYGLWLWDMPHAAAGWAADHARMTHRDPSAIESAFIVAGVTSEFIMSQTPGEGFERAMDFIQTYAGRYDEETAHLAVSSLWKGVATDVYKPEETLAALPGWLGRDAVAAALYAFAAGRGDFHQTVLLAVNHGGDSDSVGAIAGAFAGALGGASSIRLEWRTRIENALMLEGLAQRLVEARVHEIPLEVQVGE